MLLYLSFTDLCTIVFVFLSRATCIINVYMKHRYLPGFGVPISFDLFTCLISQPSQNLSFLSYLLDVWVFGLRRMFIPSQISHNVMSNTRLKFPTDIGRAV